MVPGKVISAAGIRDSLRLAVGSGWPWSLFGVARCGCGGPAFPRYRIVVHDCGWVSGKSREDWLRGYAACSGQVPGGEKRRLGGEPALGESGGFRVVVGAAAWVGSPLPFVRRVSVCGGARPLNQARLDVTRRTNGSGLPTQAPLLASRGPGLNHAAFLPYPVLLHQCVPNEERCLCR